MLSYNPAWHVACIMVDAPSCSKIIIICNLRGLIRLGLGAPIFIVTAAAASPSASDYVGAFKAKLKLHSVNRPNADAMSCLILYFPQQMMMMAQAEASSDNAMLLYKQANACLHWLSLEHRQRWTC